MSPLRTISSTWRRVVRRYRAAVSGSTNGSGSVIWGWAGWTTERCALTSTLLAGRVQSVNSRSQALYSGALLANRADSLQRLLLRSGSQWLRWSPRVFNESAPTLAACPITFRGRAIPAGYSERDFGGIAKVRFARHLPAEDQDVIGPLVLLQTGTALLVDGSPRSR